MGKHSNNPLRPGATCMQLLAAAILGAVLSAPAPLLAQSAASADAWKATVAAAQKEQKVVLYSAAANPLLTRLKADFDRANPGVVLEISRFSTGELLTKLAQERETGADGADVMIATDIAWAEDRLRDGGVKPPVGPSAQAWPARYMLRGAVPVLALEPVVMAYNTNLVKTPINSYQDLLKPELKGRIGILDLTATSIIAFYDWLEKNEGADYLARLAAQSPRIYTSSPAGGQSVGSGEIPVINFINPANIVPLIKQGAPVKEVYTKPRFGFRFIGVALGWSKRPNASQVLMDYVMSARGQTVWSGNGESASALRNIPGALDADSINPYDPAPYTPEVVKSYTAKWNTLFKGR